jgi:hypothetical protein
MYVFVFNRPDDFPEIRHFLVLMDARYGLGVDAVEGDFKDGLRSIVEKRSIKAIFLGTRRCIRCLRCQPINPLALKLAVALAPSRS